MSQTVAAPIPAAVDYERTLVLAIEVSNKSWVLAAQVPGLPHTKAKRTIDPEAEALLAAIAGYRARAAATGRSIERVIAVYEAGWSGFWLARWLMRHGVEVYVIQPSSVPVDRRMRRAKSDGIDSELLLRTLLAWLRGEPRVCSMVPVPDEADEDARRCVRERTELISERVGLTNRIGAVLATLGVSDYNPLLRNRDRRLAELRTGLGEPLPANAHAKIKRLLARLELVLTQIAELERERDAVVETEASERPKPASAPPFSACRRAVRFDVRGIDHLRIRRSSTPGQFPEQVFPDAAPSPTHKAVIDRGWRTVLGRAIAPATTAFQHMDDAADHTAIFRPFDAPDIRRQVRLNPLPLLIAQPKQILAHIPIPFHFEQEYLSGRKESELVR